MNFGTQPIGLIRFRSYKEQTSALPGKGAQFNSHRLINAPNNSDDFSKDKYLFNLSFEYSEKKDMIKIKGNMNE